MSKNISKEFEDRTRAASRKMLAGAALVAASTWFSTLVFDEDVNLFPIIPAAVCMYGAMIKYEETLSLFGKLDGLQGDGDEPSLSKVQQNPGPVDPLPR